MRKLALVSVTALCFLATSCVVRTGPRRGRKHQNVNSRCHPSEYWNGSRCVHKGKAKGHKKHKKHKRGRY